MFFKRKNKLFYISLLWELEAFKHEPFVQYVSKFEENILKVTVNNFPEQDLYSLYINNDFICHFNKWPVKWKKDTKGLL